MPKINLSAEEKKLLKKAYIGSLSCMRTTSSITGQARGMVLAVDPFIERYYATQDEKNEAILRHASEYMNTHQAMFGLIAGIVCAMEKERGEKGNLDTVVITGIKASLMGPLAGIGDSSLTATALSSPASRLAYPPTAACSVRSSSWFSMVSAC